MQLKKCFDKEEIFVLLLKWHASIKDAKVIGWETWPEDIVFHGIKTNCGVGNSFAIFLFFYPNICPFNFTNVTLIRWQSPQYHSCTALIEMSSSQSQEDEGEEVSESLEIPEKRERSPEGSDPSLVTSSLSLPPSPNAAKGGRAKVEPAKIRPARRCLDNWNSEGHTDCSSSAPAYPRGFSLAPRPPRFSASSRASSSRTPLTPSLSPSSLSSVFNCRTF